MIRSALAIVTCAVLVSGCSEVKEAVIPGKTSPDEFAVYTRAPLSLPPDYGLRAPEPGAERPQQVNPSDNAQRVTIGLEQEANARAGSGEEEMLRLAGATNVDPDIRQAVNRESSVLAEEGDTFVNNILFWQQTEPGTELDATEEDKRIRQSQTLGDPISSEDVPVIEKKEKGLLEGLF